jgi:hypothetical protein
VSPNHPRHAGPRRLGTIKGLPRRLFCLLEIGNGARLYAAVPQCPPPPCQGQPADRAWRAKLASAPDLKADHRRSGLNAMAQACGAGAAGAGIDIEGGTTCRVWPGYEFLSRIAITISLREQFDRLVELSSYADNIERG